MNINIKRFLFSMSLGATTLFFGAKEAKAVYFHTQTGHSSADIEAQMTGGTFVEEFNASSYIGDDGGPSYELETVDVDPTSGIVDRQQGQYSWESGQEVDFELSFDGKDLTYTVGGETVQSIDVSQGDFDINGMLLSANSTENSSATLKNLMFDDGSMSMEDLVSNASGEDFLKVTGIDNTFTLTGTQVFTWEGSRPSNFDLAYQIRVGTFQDPLASGLDGSEIPEPATVSLFSFGAIALGLKSLRRKVSQ
jgi:hypothetical protein